MRWNGKSARRVRIGIHIVIWLVLFYLPLLLSGGDMFRQQPFIVSFWMPLAFSSAIFYANYLWMIDRFLFQGKWVIYFSLNTIFVGVLVIASFYIRFSFFDKQMLPFVPGKGGPPPIQLFVYKDLLSQAFPIVVSIAVKTMERWTSLESKMRETENQRLQSELRNLKYQLQPHFFFNSMNNIYSLVDSSPDKAKETIHSLGRLMRYLLYETGTEKVTLQTEIEFMKRYISLMRLRMPPRTILTAEFPKVDHKVFVAPLIFISLLENAFKHGTSAIVESETTIRMVCEENRIIFTTSNSNHAKSGDDQSESGIGLNNLIQRLNLIYPDKHIFITNSTDKIFTTYLSIDTR